MPDDRPGDTGESGNPFLRLGTPVALILAIIGSGYTISTTDDRIRKAEVEVALQVRDTRLDSLRREVDRLREDVQRIDRSGPTVSNPALAEMVRDHEKRLDEIERWK